MRPKTPNVSESIRRNDLCILIPVAPDYAWLLPILTEFLREFWVPHPPVVIARARFEDTTPKGRLCWTQILQRGATEARRRGFTMAYVILEEQLPVARCHAVHLNETLPGLMDLLPASHISLMGWDNRRHPSKSPVLGKEFYRLKHLKAEKDPRYNLHPGLWRLDALLACCHEVLDKAGREASAWQFERISARSSNPSLQKQKEQCYQIRASSMALRRPPPLRKLGMAIERFFYMRMIGLMPLVPGRSRREGVFRILNFDRVFCDGPYPMVFAGVLAKGKINPNFTSIVGKLPAGSQLLERISSLVPGKQACSTISL